MRFEQRTYPPGIVICLLWNLVTTIWAAANLPGRAVIGLPLLLFIPGYLVALALFPGQNIDFFERVALSFGLSIAVVSIIGLALNYTPWGIQLGSVLLSLTGAVAVSVAVALFRWLGLYPSQRFVISFTLELTHGGRSFDRGFLIALVIIIGVVIVLFFYIVMTPRMGESFTEFYLLGPSGAATGYPTNLTSGENASVIVGVANHEHCRMNYTLETWLVNYSHYLSFDGKDDYVEVPYNQSLNIADAITVEAWVKPQSRQKMNEFLVQKVGSFLLDARRNWTTHSIFYVHVNGSYQPLHGPKLNVSWNHLAATYDSGTREMKIYYNGVLYANRTLTNLTTYKIGAIRESLLFGTRSGNNFFNGGMKDIRLYSRTLSSEEIKQNYGGDITVDGLVSWWRLEEGFENVAKDSIGPNTGYIYGGQWISTGKVKDMWFMDSMAIQLDHKPVDVEGNWKPQWEYNYNFSIKREGAFKLAFLLYKKETGHFVPGRNYFWLAPRLETAYRENHLWVTVHSHESGK